MANVLPPLPQNIDPQVRRYLESLSASMNPIVEAVNELASKSGSIVTSDDLKKIGVDVEAPRVIPPIPTGLLIEGSYSSIMLKWDKPSYDGHAYTEIWRSSSDRPITVTIENSEAIEETTESHDEDGILVTGSVSSGGENSDLEYEQNPEFESFGDNLSDAVLIGTTSAKIYSDPVGTNRKEYYWIRHVSVSGIAGPYNDDAGTVGETSPDIPYLLEVLKGRFNESMMTQSFNNRINLLDIDMESPDSLYVRLMNTRNTLEKYSDEAIKTLDESYLATDSDGDFIYEVDNEGNLVLDSDGNPISVKKWTAYKKQLEKAVSDEVENRVAQYNEFASDVYRFDENGNPLFDSDGRQVVDAQASVRELDEAINDPETGIFARSVDYVDAAQYTDPPEYNEDGTRKTKLQASVEFTKASYIDPLMEDAKAYASLKLDVNGKISGFVTENDGERTSFAIQADEFFITDGSTDGSPFYYGDIPTVNDDGTVDENTTTKGLLLNSAFIDSGFITNLVGKKINFNEAQITGNLTAANIDTSGLIADTVQADVSLDAPYIYSRDGSFYLDARDSAITTHQFIDGDIKGKIYGGHIDTKYLKAQIIEVENLIQRKPGAYGVVGNEKLLSDRGSPVAGGKELFSYTRYLPIRHKSNSLHLRCVSMGTWINPTWDADDKVYVGRAPSLTFEFSSFNSVISGRNEYTPFDEGDGLVHSLGFIYTDTTGLPSLNSYTFYHDLGLSSGVYVMKHGYGYGDDRDHGSDHLEWLQSKTLTLFKNVQNRYFISSGDGGPQYDNYGSNVSSTGFTQTTTLGVGEYSEYKYITPVYFCMYATDYGYLNKRVTSISAGGKWVF